MSSHAFRGDESLAFMDSVCGKTKAESLGSAPVCIIGDVTCGIAGGSEGTRVIRGDLDEIPLYREPKLYSVGAILGRDGRGAVVPDARSGLSPV